MLFVFGLILTSSFVRLQIVGTGSVVAAATVGLVFAQPSEPTPQRPSSHKRKLTLDYGSLRGFSRPNTRPSTSATTTGASNDRIFTSSSKPPPIPLAPSSVNVTRSSQDSSQTPLQTTPPKPTSRRPSFARQREGVPPPIAESVRDSISSNGSWMRRLSLRPLSQQGSPRSSLGPDSSSFKSWVNASGGSTLSPISAQPSQIPPNKLVKRTPSSTHASAKEGSVLSRRGSRSHMPSLRRPATSHQRSATLAQMQFQEVVSDMPSASPMCSREQSRRPSLSVRTPLEIPEEEPSMWNWSSYFHSKVLVSSGTKASSETFVEAASPGPNLLPRKSLHVRKGSMPRAYLINTAMMTSANASNSPDPLNLGPATATPSPLPPPLAVDQASASALADSPSTQSNGPSGSPEETPSKRPRRSISMHFSSPTSWISKTGSIRRQKRGSNQKSGGGRIVSAPIRTTSPIQPQICVKQDFVHSHSPPAFPVKDHAGTPMILDTPTSLHTSRAATRQRNSSSPLPTPSPLSSFNFDPYPFGASTITTSPRRPETLMPSSHSLQPSPILSSSSRFPLTTHSRDVSNERASTLAGSDSEMRTFSSGDDDDTDLKSDTLYDSFRTTGSARIRDVDTPLESMFDESPPSTAGNSKTKRLSIQEILGRSWDGDTKIMEEDEGASTPMRINDSPKRDIDLMGCDDLSSKLTGRTIDISLANRDMGRMSLDDDDDFDWARDDENGLSNHLSPPLSSMRGASPNLRLALSDISGNSNFDFARSDVGSERPERPRSNVFDWSEPPSHERLDLDGPSPRPKTVHGKQEMDVRGGRASNRKGPTVAHIRSQSVPVVPDLTEPVKTNNKFRTWASGPMNVSEDWEDDFDFDEGPASPQEGDMSSSFAMIVPASIQATQPTVKAHSGQIRELSLLVNGLKRLCRLGRELKLMEESAELWREAENIIKLASPDEDEEGNLVEEVEGSNKSDISSTNDQFVDEGFDSDAVGYAGDVAVMPMPDMSKTAVVREREVVRRRSVFAPEDDIFGGSWPLPDEPRVSRPATPNHDRETNTPDSAMISSVMEAMQQQRRSSSAPVKGSPRKTTPGSKSELFFDTNSLQELVKQANVLFHNLSDIVRRAELITQSPVSTPKREKHLRRDGSPAFTRVFTDPSSVPLTPPKSHRLLKSQSNNSVNGGRPSIESRGSPANGLSQRMQMMTVS